MKLEIRCADPRDFIIFMPEILPLDRSESCWEHFPHVADIGVRGFGFSRAASFEQAALALTSVIADLESIRPEQAIGVHCEAPNVELLFVDWLNAIIFEMDTRKMLFCEFHVSIEGNVLHGRVHGEQVCRARHAPAAEIKGATLSELEVVQEPNGRWRAQCIVDV